MRSSTSQGGAGAAESVSRSVRLKGSNAWLRECDCAIGIPRSRPQALLRTIDTALSATA